VRHRRAVAPSAGRDEVRPLPSALAPGVSTLTAGSVTAVGAGTNALPYVSYRAGRAARPAKQRAAAIAPGASALQSRGEVGTGSNREEVGTGSNRTGFASFRSAGPGTAWACTGVIAQGAPGGAAERSRRGELLTGTRGWRSQHGQRGAQPLHATAPQADASHAPPGRMGAACAHSGWP
jgi:hypothetical protein